MRQGMYATALLLIALLLSACMRPAGSTVSTNGMVTGNVTSTAQTALPAEAEVTVALVDVTLQPDIKAMHSGVDAPQTAAKSGNAAVPVPAAVVAQQQIAVNGNPLPISFNVSFEPKNIDQQHQYGLAATILDGSGALLMASDHYVPVITQGNPIAGVEVPVVPANAGATEQTAASGLTGVTWEVVSLNGNPPAQDTTITAQFGDDGTLNGSGGCNSYSASYEVDGENIKIGQATSTMMACPDPTMTQESAYLAALQSAATFSIDGGMLMLMDAGGTAVLTYRVVAQDLAGTSWEAFLFNSGGSAIVSVMNVQITANFGADGKVSGFGGCNDYSASYTADNNAIQIGPIAVTQKACSDPAGVMEQESQYLAALQSATNYQIQGQVLQMQNANGQIAVQFQRMGP